MVGTGCRERPHTRCSGDRIHHHSGLATRRVRWFYPRLVERFGGNTLSLRTVAYSAQASNKSPCGQEAQKSPLSAVCKNSSDVFKSSFGGPGPTEKSLYPVDSSGLRQIAMDRLPPELPPGDSPVEAIGVFARAERKSLARPASGHRSEQVGRPSSSRYITTGGTTARGRYLGRCGALHVRAAACRDRRARRPARRVPHGWNAGATYPLVYHLVRGKPVSRLAVSNIGIR